MGKKNNGRFNIQFTDTDPEHLLATQILNGLPPRGKASYLAKAVIHFENCDETPAIRRDPALNRKALEAIVRDILSKENRRTPAERPAQELKPATEQDVHEISGETASIEQGNMVQTADGVDLTDVYEAFGEDNIGAIVDALTAFQ